MLRAFHFRGRLKFCRRYGRQMPSRALNTHICLRTELSNTKHHGQEVKLCSSLFMNRSEEKNLLEWEDETNIPSTIFLLLLACYFAQNLLWTLWAFLDVDRRHILQSIRWPGSALSVFVCLGRRGAGPVIVIAGQSRRKQGRGGAVRAVCLRIASQPVRDNVITWFFPFTWFTLFHLKHLFPLTLTWPTFPGEDRSEPGS